MAFYVLILSHMMLSTSSSPLLHEGDRLVLSVFFHVKAHLEASGGKTGRNERSPYARCFRGVIVLCFCRSVSYIPWTQSRASRSLLVQISNQIREFSGNSKSKASKSTTYSTTYSKKKFYHYRFCPKPMKPSLNPIHVAVCSSPGIGHLTPSLRLASMLSSSFATTTIGGYKVTLVIIRPCLSSAESNQITNFLSTHPQINSFDFQLLPDDYDDSTAPIDPFLRQYIAASRSSHRLVHDLSTLSPPLSAVFSDMHLASGLNKPLADLGLPNFTIITTSARFFSFMASLPYTKDFSELNIPDMYIPPPMLDPNNAFNQLINTNCRCLKYAKGILINSFHFLEPNVIDSFNTGKIVSDLPPIYPIGPLWPFKTTTNEASDYPSWLDEQPKESVVYVSFGNRTPLSKEQIREVGEGLEKSGVKFLWVIKTTVVDKDDTGEVEELVEKGFLERTKEQGLVVKGWVSQDAILAHPSIGGFVSHCGWNSVMEASLRGIPLVAWPQHGDQRVNALVVEEAGLGIVESNWGWSGERLVKGEEIASKIKEIMTNEKLRNSANKVGEEARKACEVHQSFSHLLKMIGDQCKNGMLSS